MSFQRSLLSLFVAVALIAAASPAQAYNDDQPYYKWSPQALYASPSFFGGVGGGFGARSAGVSSTSLMGSRASPSYLRSRFGSGSFFPRGSSASASALRDSSRKRTESYSRSGCMPAGQVCLFRSGLVGAVMKLPCCEGATCTLLGAKFVCVDDRELYEPLEEEGLEPETIQLDPADLAGWNQEIFGKKKK